MSPSPPPSPAPSPAPAPAPVRCAADALAVIAMALSRPLEPETICFAIDGDGVGGVAIAIEGTDRPDDVLDVVGIIGRAARSTPATSLVVASVRPDGDLLVGDDRRWQQASAIARDHHLELLEWFVIGAGHRVHTPRDLTGEPMKWAVLADPAAHPPGAASVLGLHESVDVVRRRAPSDQPNSAAGFTT